MKQGEIWLINLDPSVGSEMKKTRPAIIVNDDNLGKLPLKVIVPVTDWKDRYQIAVWMVKLTPNATNGLSKVSSGDCFQVRSVSEKRFVRKLGEITSAEREQIKVALAKVLTIE
jgi:mRNA interferase MazF